MGDAPDKRRLQFDALTLDLTRHEARLGDEPLTLTPKEFKLLEIFTLNPGRAFTRTELLQLAFGPNYEGLERTIDVHIMNLRKKVETPAAPAIEIQTVYGVGYKLVEAKSVP
jgi:DNA-binding response OmpR family regulator